MIIFDTFKVHDFKSDIINNMGRDNRSGFKHTDVISAISLLPNMIYINCRSPSHIYVGTQVLAPEVSSLS